MPLKSQLLTVLQNNMTFPASIILLGFCICLSSSLNLKMLFLYLTLDGLLILQNSVSPPPQKFHQCFNWHYSFLLLWLYNSSNLKHFSSKNLFWTRTYRKFILAAHITHFCYGIMCLKAPRTAIFRIPKPKILRIMQICFWSTLLINWPHVLVCLLSFSKVS